MSAVYKRKYKVKKIILCNFAKRRVQESATNSKRMTHLNKF